MLSLASSTGPEWVARVETALPELLLDHAHLERKAAATALHLLGQYPHHRFLQEPLAEVAREELAHFELLLRVLGQRGIPFRPQSPSPYMRSLLALRRPREPERLVDRLLCCALVEARSCERFRLLSAALEDAELAALYGGLLASEARHHGLYLELAGRLAPAEEVRARLRDLSRAEAAILREAPARVRMHC